IDNLVFRWVADPEKPAPVYRPVKGQDAPRAPVGEILRKKMAAVSWIAPPSILVPEARDDRRASPDGTHRGGSEGPSQGPSSKAPKQD
ncbi:MAG TPA: hypothetical protein VIM14_07470, partial [Polyangia bacterium]